MNEWETCIDEWAGRLRDAQATIADLQGQLSAIETALDIDSGKSTLDKVKDLHRSFKQTWASYQDAVNELFKAQQRVAQLEGDVEEQKRNYQGACVTIAKMYEAATGTNGCGPKRGVVEDLADLQADHARVLGLVQALPMAGLPVEHARSDDFVVLQTNGEWMAHTYNYWAKFATEEEAQAYIALLEYRASLPSQPAQGHEHTWGTDGAHSNEFCKVCFVNKPQPAQGGA